MASSFLLPNSSDSVVGITACRKLKNTIFYILPTAKHPHKILLISVQPCYSNEIRTDEYPLASDEFS